MQFIRPGRTLLFGGTAAIANVRHDGMGTSPFRRPARRK
jgi:hypothetical protein